MTDVLSISVLESVAPYGHYRVFMMTRIGDRDHLVYDLGRVLDGKVTWRNPDYADLDPAGLDIEAFYCIPITDAPTIIVKEYSPGVWWAEP